MGALDIARVGEGIDALLLGDEVLDVHLAGYGFNGGAALVAVLVPQGDELVLQDGLDAGVVGQDFPEVPDAGVQPPFWGQPPQRREA